MHDLLHDPLISVRLPQGEARLNLPELLAALARGEVLPAGAFTSLGQLRLAEFDPLFAQWGMVTAVVEENAEAAPSHGT